jgi:hypothetical protein
VVVSVLQTHFIISPEGLAVAVEGVVNRSEPVGAGEIICDVPTVGGTVCETAGAGVVVWSALATSIPRNGKARVIAIIINFLFMSISFSFTRKYRCGTHFEIRNSLSGKSKARHQEVAGFT